MKETLWNDGWKTWQDKNSFALIWSVPDDAETVDLPHDAMIYERPHAQSVNGGKTGFRDGTNQIYVKSFSAPEEWFGKPVIVKFEGVYMNALVYCNGALVANNPYGYTTFYADISEHLQSENELRVLVKNSNMPNSRWYSGTGIYRDVYLLTGGKNHIVRNGVRVTAGKDGKARVQTEIAGEGEVTVAILDAYGKTVGDGKGADCTVTVAEPALWSADTPNLYTCKVSLNSGEDSAETLFGFRTLELDSAHGLRVNGETVKLRGACIHHDNGPIGAAEYDGAAFRRVRLMKEAGFNAIRMSHHPVSDNLLRACDALGMYIMEEAFDMWTRPKSDLDYALYFSDRWERDVAAMVRKCYNHPSVIMYSLGNEIPEIGSRQGGQILRRMVDLVKSIDSTRYTLCGINGVFAAGDRLNEVMADVATMPDGSVNDFMSVMDTKMDEIVVHPAITEKLDVTAEITDISGYNYMTARYEPDSKTYPSRVMVGSETYPPDIARNWEIAVRLPALIGDFTWTGWDYIGEAGVGVPAYKFGEGGFAAGFPCQLAYCGDIDITGFRRPISYFREIAFGLRNQPYISVQNPHRYGERLIKTPWVMSDSTATWNWRGCEGKPAVVEVFSNAEAVELFQDGVSLGQKPVNGCIATFEAVYRPGLLRAVNLQNGNPAGEWTLCSAKGDVSVKVATRDEGQLIYAEIALFGENGVVYTDEIRKLKLEVNGPAVLLGFCSGDPKTPDYYPDDTATTWNGRALAVLKRTVPGEVTVRAYESK